MTDHSRLVSAIPERASFSAYRPDLRPSVAFVKRWSGSLLGYACCNWRPPTSGLRTWTADGTCERILDHVVVKDDSVGNVEWTIGVDSSNVRAHQHSTGPGKGDAPPTGPKPSPSTGKPSAAPDAG
jgi:hypothetical protein